MNRPRATTDAKIKPPEWLTPADAMLLIYGRKVDRKQHHKLVYQGVTVKGYQAKICLEAMHTPEGLRFTHQQIADFQGRLKAAGFAARNKDKKGKSGQKSPAAKRQSRNAAPLAAELYTKAKADEIGTYPLGPVDGEEWEQKRTRRLKLAQTSSCDSGADGQRVA